MRYTLPSGEVDAKISPALPITIAVTFISLRSAKGVPAPLGVTLNIFQSPPVPRYTLPAESTALDQMYGWPVLNISLSFGARLIVPFASIDTPRASPLRTSARELTDQTCGSAALAIRQNE